MWYKYMVDYYSAIRREKIVSFSKTRIDLEIVVRSEVTKIYIIVLICEI